MAYFRRIEFTPVSWGSSASPNACSASAPV
jgi:hypothetical protein